MQKGRVEKSNGQYCIAYGVDHAFGIFIQVWRPSDCEKMLVDKDAWTHGITASDVIEIAEGYGFHLSDETSQGEEEIQTEDGES